MFPRPCLFFFCFFVFFLSFPFFFFFFFFFCALIFWSRRVCNKKGGGVDIPFPDAGSVLLIGRQNESIKSVLDNRVSRTAVEVRMLDDDKISLVCKSSHSLVLSSVGSPDQVLKSGDSVVVKKEMGFKLTLVF